MGHWSDGHLYMDNRKNRNINIRYALIEHGGDVFVFDGIYAAECFCMEHELDPDKVIQSWDEDVRDRCRQVAKTSLVALNQSREALQKLYKEAGEQVDNRVAIKEIHEKSPRNWDKSLDEEYLTNAIGEHSGIHRAMVEFEKVREVYLNILWYA